MDGLNVEKCVGNYINIQIQAFMAENMGQLMSMIQFKPNAHNFLRITPTWNVFQKNA